MAGFLCEWFMPPRWGSKGLGYIDQGLRRLRRLTPGYNRTAQLGLVLSKSRYFPCYAQNVCKIVSPDITFMFRSAKYLLSIVLFRPAQSRKTPGIFHKPFHPVQAITNMSWSFPLSTIPYQYAVPNSRTAETG